MAKKYSLTPKHRSQLKPWADMWIANAMSVKPTDEAERNRMRAAVRDLYEAANLRPPPDHRIIFVPSPFVLRFAGGFAAWIWHQRKHGDAATEAATMAATEAATEAATWDATMDATRAATMDATRDAWYRLNVNAMRAVAAAFGGRAALVCAHGAYRLWNGGNQWSGWPAFLSFFRHISGLPIDYSKWSPYEELAHAGPRIMHAEFCIISERPTKLCVDDRNRPHCADGPFCEWRDGAALYSWHGTRVPGWVLEHPDRITVARIEAETNQEVRRVMVERYGAARYMQDCGASVVSEDDYGTLYQRDETVMVRVRNSTPEPDGSIKAYWLHVHPELRPMLGGSDMGEPQEMTARNAVASTFGLRGEEYAPEMET